MTKKILKSIILFSLAAVFFSSLTLLGLMGIYFGSQLHEELESHAVLIGSGIENGGADYLEGHDFYNTDVAWFGTDGALLYSSEEDDDDRTQDDAVREAFSNGSGRSSKGISSYSYALKLDDGTVVEVSRKHPFYSENGFAAVIGHFLIVLTAVSLLSIVIANAASKRIVRPINEIDLENPRANKEYPELEPLLNKLRAQNGRVNRQLRELGSRRDQFSLITENMDEGMMIADKKLNILTCNSSAMKLLGVEGDFSGQSIFALNNTETFRRCIQNAAGGRRSECILETPDGGRAVIASPAGSTDTLNGIFVLVIDVTERQKLEMMRREFTSNVSHELKTPLTTIYGMSDMIANGMVKPDDTAEFGGKIRDEADRLIKLTNDIMSLSHLDEAEALDNAVELDLYELSAEIIDRLSMNAAEKNVELHLAGEHVIYSGNRMILDEIICNLCDNAIKYNRDGGAVEIAVKKVRRNVVITVSDTGIGIPKEHIERVFERFYRVDKSRSRKIKGTGLGLSIVKHGAIYHGGSVSAKSTPGKGTIFTVELPVR